MTITSERGQVGMVGWYEFGTDYLFFSPVVILASPQALVIATFIHSYSRPPTSLLPFY